MKNIMKTTFVMAAVVAGIALGKTSQAQGIEQVAVTPSVFLNLEVTRSCDDKGAVFKVINRGAKWPQTGYLRLYYADDGSLISERRVRLADGQKVSFVVRHKIMNGRPVGVWIDPSWYGRDFEFDASIKC